MLLVSVMSAITKRANARQRGDGFGKVSAGRFLEIEKDRQVIPTSKLVSDGVEDCLAFWLEAAKD